MPELKAVLWDMDGTLIDSEPNWVLEERRLMDAAGLIWDESDSSALVGQALAVTATAMQKRGLGMELEEVLDSLIDGAAARLRESVPWQAGAQDLLDGLRETDIHSALVTMSHQRVASAVVESVPEWFVTVVTGDVVERGKPEPDPYLLAMDRLGVAPEECLAFEDSLPGVASALAAGAVTVAVERHIPLGGTGAHHLLTTFEGMGIEDLRQIHAGGR